MRLAVPLLAAACVFASAAHASAGGPVTVTCDRSINTVLNVGYVDCQGPLGGNIAAGQVDTATFAGWGSYQLAGTSNDGSGVFAAVDSADGLFGTLTLAHAQKGSFVIGIKGGPTYSLYLFSAADVPGGISQLDFDTFGVTQGNGKGGPALSHLALFTAPDFTPHTSPVPEAGSGSMLAAGLAALGFVARRRRPR